MCSPGLLSGKVPPENILRENLSGCSYEAGKCYGGKKVMEFINPLTSEYLEFCVLGVVGISTDSYCRDILLEDRGPGMFIQQLYQALVVRKASS